MLSEVDASQKVVISKKDRKEFLEKNLFGRQTKIREIFSGLIDEQKELAASLTKLLESGDLSEEKMALKQQEKAEQEIRQKSLEDRRDKAEEIFDEIRRIEVPRSFKDLLAKKGLYATDPASKEEVSYFFSMATNPDSEIKEGNKNKLLSFFQGNRKELAYLFKTPQGLNNFVGTIGSLGDGCVANISTQCKVALYKELITDPCDQILYLTFYDRIATPMINNSKTDMLGSSASADILTNYSINEGRVSPLGLVKALKEEFFVGGKPTIRKSWEFIIHEISESRRELLKKELVSRGIQNPDIDAVSKVVNKKYEAILSEILVNQELESPEDTAAMAAYVILKKTREVACKSGSEQISKFDILGSKYLEQFKAVQEEILDQTESAYSRTKNTEIAEYLETSGQALDKIETPNPSTNRVGEMSKAARRLFGGLTASVLSQVRRRNNRFQDALIEGRKGGDDHDANESGGVGL